MKPQDNIESAVERLVSQLFVVLYEDEGPNGICGQSIEITCHWSKAYLFKSEGKMREFIEKVDEYKKGGFSRRNPRITRVYLPRPYSNEVNYIGG